VRLSRIALSSACALLVASTVLAQQPPRTIIEVNRQKVLPGHAGQYEAARKKHMEWHKQAGDQWTWTVWEVTSGPDTGTYLVTTANHQWADYDSWTAKNGAGDSADSSASIGPHVAGNDRSYWTTRPDLSLWPTSNDLPPMGTLTVYYLKPGMGDQFASAVTKLTGALGKSKWPLNSMWYQLLNGGEPAGRPLTDDAQHLAVEHLRVVDAQRAARARQQGGQPSPRVERADDEVVGLRRERPPRDVGVEELRGLADQALLPRDHREAAAPAHLHAREVEAHHVKRLIHDEHLVVVADQVVGRPRHGDPVAEEPKLEIAKELLARPVRVSDERVNTDAARHSVAERLLELRQVAAEDRDAD